MGFRFRKSVTLFPGVRLNFSGGGISTTLGVRGASVNISGRGSYLTVGLPGTGLSYRTRLDRSTASSPLSPTTGASNFHAPPQRDLEDFSPHDFRPNHVVLSEGEIRSAALSQLTSAGLGELKKLINEADQRTETVRTAIGNAKFSKTVADAKLRSARRFIVRLFLWSSIPARQQAVIDLNRRIEELEAELLACHIDLDFAFDEQTFAAHEALSTAFGRLGGCDTIWDVTSSVRTNQGAERTLAANAVSLKPIRLSRRSSDLLNTKFPAIVFENANGSDIHLYPGFVMMRDQGRQFALIDLREVTIAYRPQPFHEASRVPRDTRVIGQTWAKTNKDGSPDRRFKSNYQIPIVEYGRLTFRSGTGLNEEYMVSNAPAAEAFGTKFEAYRQVLNALARKRPDVEAASPPFDQAETPEDILDETLDPVVKGRPAPLALVGDALVVMGLLGMLGFGAKHYPTAPVMNVKSESVGQARSADETNTPVPTVFVVNALDMDSAKPSDAKAPEPPAVAVKETKQGAPSTSEPLQGTVVVKAQAANLRSEPSRTSTVVFSAPAGTRLSVFSTSGEWFHVGETQPRGWMHRSLVESAPR